MTAGLGAAHISQQGTEGIAMRRNKLWSLIACGLLSFGGVRGASAAGVGYTLDVTTNYASALPGGTFTDKGGPNPDTGYFTIKNNGLTTFTGTIGDIAVSTGTGDYSYSHGGLTLNPGDYVNFAVNQESSNQGGYNGPFGSPQPGVIIKINGTISDGVNSEVVALSVDDSSIHSGAFRTNPFGVTLDNYVLQGGDPIGRDTGDGYEETQAAGHFEFAEAAAVAPTPAAALSGLAMLGGLAIVRSVRRKAATTN
jgi:hypothetical protein